MNYVVNVNYIILNREKEDRDTYYQVTVFKVFNHHWTKVKWGWEVFTPGSIIIVHVTWIKLDSARKIRVLNYSKENTVVNLESLGVTSTITHFIQHSFI